MSDTIDRDAGFDQDTLIAYALGMLDSDEAERVERELATHPGRLVQVRAHLDALAALALSDEPSELPGGAEAELLARIRSPRAGRAEGGPEPHGDEHEDGDQTGDEDGNENGAALPPIITAPAPRRARPWLALAAALVLLALGYGVLRPVASDALIAYQVRRYQAQQGAVSEALVSSGGSRLGLLIRLGDDRVVVAMDAAAPRERVYQAWEIADGSDPMSRGTWRGRLFTSEPLSDGNLFGISLEPPGGSPQPTSTPIVVLPL